MQRFKKWWEEKKYRWACTIISSHGFSIVRLINRAGTDYILGNDGQMYAVGRRKKK